MKESDDSVIFQGSNKKLQATMEARSRRLERFHTMPNIKVEVSTSSFKSNHATDADNKINKTEVANSKLNKTDVTDSNKSKTTDNLVHRGDTTIKHDQNSDGGFVNVMTKPDPLVRNYKGRHSRNVRHRLSVDYLRSLKTTAPKVRRASVPNITELYNNITRPIAFTTRQIKSPIQEEDEDAPSITDYNI